MAKRTGQRQIDLPAAQTQAHAYVVDYLSNTPLGLPEDLTEAQFSQVMDAITRAMINAYAKGYLDGR